MEKLFRHKTELNVNAVTHLKSNVCFPLVGSALYHQDLNKQVWIKLFEEP